MTSTPSAPGEVAETVTLTLPRSDVEMLRALIDERNLYVWDDQQRAYRITPSLVQALDKALAAKEAE